MKVILQFLKVFTISLGLGCGPEMSFGSILHIVIFPKRLMKGSYQQRLSHGLRTIGQDSTVSVHENAE
jgi:hypothetical protein